MKDRKFMVDRDGQWSPPYIIEVYEDFPESQSWEEVRNQMSYYHHIEAKRWSELNLFEWENGIQD